MITAQRVLQPYLWTRDDFLALKPLERLTCLGLHSYADAYGRERTIPQLIKAEIYPMDDEITVDVIEDHLLALAERDVIHLYIEMEREYFHFTQWDDDQPVAVSKAARTFIPAPSACEACADSDERFSDSLSHFRLYSQKEGGSREGEAERVPESGASSQGDEGQSDERRSDERPGREAPALPPGAPQAPSSGRQCVTDGLCREGQPCSPEPVAWCKKHAGGTEYPCGPCGTARLRARRHEKLHGN